MWGIRALARRGLATAAKPATAAAASPPPAAGPEVALPLKLFGLPARYASALYVAAAKAKELPSVEKELLSVVDLAKKEPKFGLFLRDPSASTGDKLKGVASFLEAGKFSATTKNFFAVLAENGRLAEVELISSKFEELMMASRGEVKAVVTSAEPLTAEEFSSAKAALEKLLEKGQLLNLKAEVNPEIIGGLVFDIGDKHLDLSLNTRIRKVEQMLSQSVQ